MKKRAPRLIGLAGLARSGKDSAASVLVESGWVRRAFADPLKELVYAVDPLVPHPDGRGTTRLRAVVDRLGWEGAKNLAEVRSLLQRVGTEAGRGVLGENVWVDRMFRDAESWAAPTVITDVRFSNEAEAIQQRGGLVVLVVRPRQMLIDGCGHASERGLDGYPFDATILNTGSLEQLGASIKVLARD
ncbi:deoxynucleotide monophosphate kinase family protein [Kitasatospora sp. NPDC001574]